MQFGHNDGGKMFEGDRPRASIKGNGDESKTGTVEATGKEETVRSFGWYLRNYCQTAQAKGATPIVCSLIPRNIRDKEGVIQPDTSWAEFAAQQTGSHFIPLNQLLCDRFNALSEAQVDAIFCGTDHTHTSYPGADFHALVVADGIIANHAESGRALYSFRGERRLEKILSTIQADDYLFIQFGHNDQKDKRDGAGAFTSYKEDLESYLATAREKKATPVLITPMERRRWKDGKPQQTLTDFAAAVRQVGEEPKIPVIDLHAMSLEFYQALGEEGSRKAFVHYPPNTFPGQNAPLKDDTHHNN
jgi:lysophospholipase L1-like esterase